MHTFPKLHNAAWPGLVGKEPDTANPPIPLETMLDYTAAAEVGGQKFDGIDLFLADPHVSIDASRDDLERLAEQIGYRNLVVGSVVAPIWEATGGGGAMDPGAGRKAFLKQVEKGCRIAKELREIGIRRYGVVRIDSATPPADWAAHPEIGTKAIAETFQQAADIAADHGERLAAEGEICWAGMHSWREMLNLLEAVDRPGTLGFQADMAHTWLYLMGYNAPDDALLPRDFDFDAEGADAQLDAAYAEMVDGPPPLDDRLPRRPERRHRPRHGQSRQNRPALPARRPRRQARHPEAGRRLAGRGAGARHQTRLLGRLHVPQRRDGAAGNVERHPQVHDRRPRRPRVGVKSPTNRDRQGVGPHRPPFPAARTT